MLNFAVVNDKKNTILKMKRNILFVLFVLLLGGMAQAQETAKSELQERAEADIKKGNPVGARYLYVKAYEEYARKKLQKEAVECGVNAVDLYCKDNKYKEAFELLRNVEHTITGVSDKSERAALFYQTSRQRMQMYSNIHKPASVKEQLEAMERQANASGDDAVINDMLYNKTLYYYSIGQTQNGNAAFKEMASRMTDKKEYNRVEEVYKTLINNGRRMGNANLLHQSYSSYIAWKDSIAQLQMAAEIDSLKNKITEGEEGIQQRDKSLSRRRAAIVALSILALVLAVVLALAIAALLRSIMLTRRLKQKVRIANENIALKAHFIGNISAQLAPTLQKLDGNRPEVVALRDFSQHIQTLSELESTPDKSLELEDVQIQSYCEEMIESVRNKVRMGVNLKVDAPKINVQINRDFVSHILQHLLSNASEYTPEGGSIWLDFKKRGPHSHQFIVSNTGSNIPEEKREDIFKPFLEVRDLTQGDGLGLPICRQMALNMNGDLTIDPTFTKGTRFVLNLHV